MIPAFRTEVDVQPFPFDISYKTPIIFCGSCFTENIGRIMVERKMPALVNPFGVVYNPLSVKLVIERIIQATPLTESDLRFRDGLWYSYLHHSSYSSSDKNKCLAMINYDLSHANKFIKSANCLLVTFGTARVYYLKENNQPVTNCHKVPSKEFNNNLMSVEEIVTSWSELIDLLLSQTPCSKIVFTISPVRHWKDGAVGNQQSKSILNVAIHKLILKYPDNAFYFPSYEILMDDLRDYRYYADDMLHPSKVAVEYIWEKFKKSLIESKSITLMEEIEKVISAVNHKPFNPNIPEHRAFVANTLELIKKIKKKNSSLNFTEEENTLLGFL
ncbi:MAG: GSCFA domain-containing protein [Bacteroidales bacterium]|nr:GSCFA domain-containing protein [Bacteroidales bacterium]